MKGLNLATRNKVMRVADRQFTAALFDVDGTLIDSNDAHADAWVRALHDHDIPVDVGRIRPLIGKGGDKLLCETVGIEEDSAIGRSIRQRKKATFAKMLPGLRPTPGARELLVHLHGQGVTLGTATSADDSELHQLLRQAGVDDLFHLRASKDDAGESKPDPDIVEAALARARSRPESTVMIGDTPYDIEAADRAGIASIAVRCGGYWSDNDLKNAIAIFDDPAQLLNVVREA
jgi:HAD superfamily hydrolase (TIGR01509 family)